MMTIWWRRVGEGEGLKGEIAWVELSLTLVTGKQRVDEEEDVMVTMMTVMVTMTMMTVMGNMLLVTMVLEEQVGREKADDRDYA